ncbi:MAG: creatininase family protein [Fimbriimonadia bacterium]|jgi:creatinine amidohydrolase
MHFGDMTWRQVEAYLETDDRVIAIFGACEQHCGLSLLTDIRIPLEIAGRVAERERVLVAPPLNFGLSAAFRAYPGTISLGPEAFCAAAREILLSLYEQGFKRIMVLNGHGANTPLASILQESAEAHHDLQLQLVEWWRLPVVAEYAERVGSEALHANWAECFSFTRIDQPQGEKPPAALPRFVPGGWLRGVLSDGSFGGHYQQPDATMDAMLDDIVAEVARLIREGWPS